jgi:hypothetical protein
VDCKVTYRRIDRSKRDVAKKYRGTRTRTYKIRTLPSLGKTLVTIGHLTLTGR